MPYAGKTEIVFMIDCSGSMDHLCATVNKAYNQFLLEQSTPQGELFITLIEFDQSNKVIYENKSQYNLPSYRHTARGGTAITDCFVEAMGGRVLPRLKSTKEENLPEHKIFVLITDGGEGSGYDRDRAKSILKEMKNDGWLCIYICPSGDTDPVANGIGFDKSLILRWDTSDKGLMKAFFEISKKTAMLRSTDE